MKIHSLSKVTVSLYFFTLNQLKYSSGQAFNRDVTACLNICVEVHFLWWFVVFFNVFYFSKQMSVYLIEFFNI